MQKIITALCLAALCSGATAASMYQWTDERGVLQFGQQPPVDRPYRIVDITTPPPPGGALRERQSIPAAGVKTDKDAAERSAARKQASELKQHCDHLRQNLETLSNNPRLTRTTASGEVERIGEAERQKMIADTRSEIDSTCK